LTPIIKRLTENVTTKIYPQLHVSAVLSHHYIVIIIISNLSNDRSKY